MTATQPSNTGTPTLPPPPAPPVDGVGSGGSADDGKPAPKPGSMASEPLDVLLAKWRGPYSWTDEESTLEGYLEHSARRDIADIVDAYRAGGFGYAAALKALDDARALLPAAPAPIPAEDALEEAA
ncbi:hypothetical protein MTE01_28680 [Microbacterium testaceum]|uniref:Uncharacterized protein n=1 Tax=Microbacterium testaceum TaxID=2033 RepID=A0A4Y3QQH4_MICTE|nr:hypothetical protein [Microbacterium testaceum]GEB46923.1 hypothetical protein MTE01_28680 [Microbacterium testaceum]